MDNWSGEDGGLDFDVAQDAYILKVGAAASATAADVWI